MEQQAKKNFLIDFSFAIVIFTLVLVIGKFTVQYLTPFVLAVIIAYLCQKPAFYISKRLKINKGFCAAFLAASIYVLAVTVASLIFYGFFIAAGKLTKEIPDFLTYISDLLYKLEEKFYNIFENLTPEITDYITLVMKDSLGDIAHKLTNYFSLIAANTAKKTPSFLFSSIVALVASCYIAKDYDGLKRFLQNICGKNIYSNIIKVKIVFSQSILKLLKGYFLLTLLTFAELLIGFWILNFKLVLILAMAVALVDLLPVLGTGTVLIPWGIIEIALGNSFKGIGVLLLYLVITVVRNFAEPKIIGGQIGINPLFTLLSMFIGLKLLGCGGVIILPIIFIVTVKYYKNEMEADKRQNNA